MRTKADVSQRPRIYDFTPLLGRFN